jgi:hypothetical protein
MFSVKDKKGIKDPKFSYKMFISPNSFAFGYNFGVRPDEADTLINTHPKCCPETRRVT